MPSPVPPAGAAQPARPYLPLRGGDLQQAVLRKALRSARASEARLRLVAEHGIDAGWLLDCASGQLLYVSPALGRLFGGGDVGQWQALVQPLLVDLPQRIGRYLDGDGSRRTVVRVFEQADAQGHPIPVEVTSTLVDGAAGPASLLVGVLRDIRAEQAEELARKRFTSMLSHEFRSPLATIDGAIQRLEMTATDADEATRKRYRKIQTGVDRLLALLDEHLSPERMAAIGRRRAPDGIAPRALLDGAAGTALASDTSGRQIRVDCQALPARLRGDPDGLKLCLQILLDNAIRYTPAGTPIELIGRAAAEGGVELLVLDRGPGVFEDERERLFDKFFRGAASAGHAGSGLGLYMARAVLDVHGGSVSAANRGDGQGGAAFRIWLPQDGAGKSLASTDCKRDNSPMHVSDTGQKSV